MADFGTSEPHRKLPLTARQRVPTSPLRLSKVIKVAKDSQTHSTFVIAFQLEELVFPVRGRISHLSPRRLPGWLKLVSVQQ